MVEFAVPATGTCHAGEDTGGAPYALPAGTRCVGDGFLSEGGRCAGGPNPTPKPNAKPKPNPNPTLTRTLTLTLALTLTRCAGGQCARASVARCGDGVRDGAEQCDDASACCVQALTLSPALTLTLTPTLALALALALAVTLTLALALTLTLALPLTRARERERLPLRLQHRVHLHQGRRHRVRAGVARRVLQAPQRLGPGARRPP